MKMIIKIWRETIISEANSLNMKAVRSYLCVLVILFCCIQGESVIRSYHVSFVSVWISTFNIDPDGECVLIFNFCVVYEGNVYYPGFKRNFWLEFSSPSPASERSPGPVSSSASPLRPLFLHPSTNGSVQTVTLGRSTRIDCMVTNLNGYQVESSHFLSSWRHSPLLGLLAQTERAGGEPADHQPAGVQPGQQAGGQPGAGPAQLGPRHTVSPGEGQRELPLSGNELQ